MDPKLDALTTVVTQWQRVIGSVNVSVRDVIERATEQRTATGTGSLAYPKMEFIHADFHESLLTVAGEGGVINSRRLGKWLGAQQGRIVHGLRLVRQGLSEGTLQWRLEIADGARAQAAE